MYANTGLRTMEFAMRYLTKDLVGVNANQKDVERDYDLLGVTGLEDVL